MSLGVQARIPEYQTVTPIVLEAIEKQRTRVRVNYRRLREELQQVQFLES